MTRKKKARYKPKKEDIFNNIDSFFNHGIDILNRTIYFGDIMMDDDSSVGVSELTSEMFIKALHLLETQSDDPITIIMNSTGGELSNMWAIYDAIQTSPAEITVKVYGNCLSAASVIIQAADKRLMAPNAKMMIHEGTSAYPDQHSRTNKKWIEAEAKDDLKVEDIYYNKIIEKNYTYPRENLQKLLVFDTILTPEEALALNLCDGVIE